MPRSEKERLAAEFEERWIDFQMALSDKRKYPVQQFRIVWEIGRRYAEMTEQDALSHGVVVSVASAITDYLTCDRKPVSEEVVPKVQRLESLVFAGIRLLFQGHEPSGL